ncbi:DUF2779 domain-containing protein [Mycoplasma sp. 'Moose RK']|uniref:DUF2779 domain-containing protein n=1 Tax=Mycoplasma sp. 'Moose RK' TaxID=2780095 RepID=UPI0018C2C5AE|nr:DUF2779 domain-containing protein [Mycoplasma sp. 'Moose RK']MBG0730880.1 DUF2779 domain-containing protein [Mycoplasma sp. 'Moose RK']
MTKITFSHYFRLNTRQKYFVWHQIDSDFYDRFDFDNENDNDSLWDFDGFDQPSNFIDLHANIFENFAIEFRKHIDKEYSTKKICTVTKLITAEKIAQTKAFLESGQCEIILNPCFLFENAISQPSVFFVFNKKISILKLSTSTKIRDYLRANWDFWITTYALRQIFPDLEPVRDISFFLLDTVEFPKEKAIEFTEIFWLSQNKSPRNAKKSDLETSRRFFAKKIAKQIGMTLDEFENEKFLEANKIIKSLELQTIQRFLIKKPKITKMVPVKSAIIEILAAQKVKEFGPPEKIDNSPFEKNPEFSLLLANFNEKLTNFSGTILKAKKALELVEDPSGLILLETNSFWFKFFQRTNQILLNDLKKTKLFLEKLNNKKLVWFDFEAFSLPYPPIDFVQPYQQIVFQVSIVITVNGKILEQDFLENNLVFDPKGYNWENCYKIIETIYQDDVDFYLVFNQSYEQTRLFEMLQIIFANFLQKYSRLEATKKMEKYTKMVQEIVAKIVDLKDPFAKSWVLLSDLKGFYSIKKIEYFINKYNYKLKHLIVPYKELEIQNGLQAMKIAINRYLNFVGDHEWEKASKNLRIYCQNDVVAMIMVWDFLNFICENVNKIANISSADFQPVKLF